jgi:ADP-ribose pyrophosphatase YjhB (NUDIX family)
LLLKDSREPMLGCWAPPHGRCEASDTSETAGVVREVLEETGLKVVPVKRVFTQAADTKVKTVSFWLVKAELAAPIRLNNESSAYGWYSVKTLLKMRLYPGTRTFFKRVLAGEIKLEGHT